VAELPRVGTAMYVMHAEGVNYRSRLESIDGGTLSVAAPLETNESDLPRPGQVVEVFWAQPRARIILPCKLVEIAESPYRWVLEPIAAPVVSNRREYVRGGGGPAVALAVDEEEQFNGRLLDISEGGLRCWVATPASMKVGDKIQASVALGGGDVEVEAAVHTVRAAVEEPGHHVILTFRTPETVARVIRQHVYAWEIAERRREAEL
jgi:c-di-GMP-binding flagellar brake protein YcgR